jgi:hypothetical protein
MKETYETLDDYLDELDRIKAKVVEETKGLSARQVKAYFAQAARNLERKTGLKLQVRRSPRKKPGTRRRSA